MLPTPPSARPDQTRPTVRHRPEVAGGGVGRLSEGRSDERGGGGEGGGTSEAARWSGHALSVPEGQRARLLSTAASPFTQAGVSSVPGNLGLDLPISHGPDEVLANAANVYCACPS